MPTDYKFCKDCQYYYIMDGGLLPRCARVDQRVDLVTGERVPMFCEAARVGVQCGPDALCFQPKEAGK